MIQVIHTHLHSKSKETASVWIRMTMRWCRLKPAPVLYTGGTRYKIFDAIMKDEELKEALDFDFARAYFVSEDWHRQALSDAWEDVKIKLIEFGMDSGKFDDQAWEKILEVRRKIYEARVTKSKVW